jgi:hypothetical protein
MKVAGYLLLILSLSGCAAWERMQRRAWEKDGACATVCDYRQGYLSAVYTLSPTQCRCNTPQLADFNAQRSAAGFQPLDDPNVTLTCTPDCKTEALHICAHQPWRCPEY